MFSPFFYIGEQHSTAWLSHTGLIQSPVEAQVPSLDGLASTPGTASGHSALTSERGKGFEVLGKLSLHAG